jgi:hypothetical protein
MQLGRAIDKFLGEPPEHAQEPWSMGKLDQIVSWWLDRENKVKREIRQDLKIYLKDFYESDLEPPEVEPENGRVTEDLQVLYTFAERAGEIVNDVSEIGSPLNLTIEDKNTVSWIEYGGLLLNERTIIISTQPAAKIIQAAKAGNEITIEAWIKPANKKQGGPARIVTLSDDHRNRDFTLAQDRKHYKIRLRTTETDDNGIKDHKEQEVRKAVTLDKVSHLVYTREKSGTARFYIDGHQARFYIDGNQVDSINVGGTFANWDDSYRLGLGNEFKGDDTARFWCGELHVVAIYSRALSLTEVKQNFNAGITRH